MIDPVSAYGAAEALAGITAGMAGLTPQQAYDAKMDSYYEDVSGLHIGVGNWTSDVPAISGDTSDTIVDSSESDPQEAWLDWMHDGGLVDETTGGALLGSSAQTINFSVLDTVVGASPVAKAIQPVAVPLSLAVLAISQVLGVSMDYTEMETETKRAISDSFLNMGAMMYDKAQNLALAWWDGVNMLFPKATIDAMHDALEYLNIGPAGPSEYTQDGDTIVSIDGSVTGYGYYVAWEAEHFVNVGGVAFGYSRVNPPVIAYSVNGTTIPFNSNKTYSVSGVGTIYRYGGIAAANIDISAMTRTDLSHQRVAEILYLGTVTPGGSYPEGTYQSQATSYNPADLVAAGSVIGKNNAGQYTSTPVVAVNLPDNVESTKQSTLDPTRASDPNDVKDLPAPPIPLPIPDTNVSNPDVPLVDSSVVNSELINELVEDLANTVDPQPPRSIGLIPIPPFMPGTPVDPTDPSAGSSYPSIVPASGSGFIHVYNPTPGEFVSFGNWLWVTYADATIDKIWNNPFDGVLGAHELYATPSNDGTDNIRSGFLVCPTTAALVRNRYTEIDCGTVVVPEFYGNYLDYSPYSQCYIYLPFIGINEVSIDDIVGHAVNIRYRVDSYTGSCIAMIYVAKQGYRNLCYQFAGNCAVEVPLAGGSQAAIKAGMMQAEAYGRATVQSAQIQKTAKIGTGIVGGAASGAGAGAMNPVAGIVGGLLGALAGGTSGYIQGSADYGAAKLNAGAMQEAARVANKSSVQHSGQFGASHGAMGLKVPFIMVRNPIQVKVVNYNQDYGFPAHKRVIIGGCTGYLRVREVNVISPHATNEEKIAIETALKEGVYVS